MICSELKKEGIYREFHPKVSAYIASHINNKSEVEDLAASVFLKIYSSLGKYDENKASLSTWIYAITKNTVINHIRRQKFIFVPLTDVAGIDVKNEQDETEELLKRLD